MKEERKVGRKKKGKGREEGSIRKKEKNEGGKTRMKGRPEERKEER